MGITVANASVHLCTHVCMSYHERMPANTSAEMGIRELRAALSDVLNETAVRGRITYVTSRGRRIAAIVPVPEAEAIEEQAATEAEPTV